MTIHLLQLFILLHESQTCSKHSLRLCLWIFCFIVKITLRCMFEFTYRDVKFSKNINLLSLLETNKLIMILF